MLELTRKKCEYKNYDFLGEKQLLLGNTCLFQGSRQHRRLGTPASPFLEPPHDLEKHIFTMDDSMILTALRVNINFAIFDFNILRLV